MTGEILEMRYTGLGRSRTSSTAESQTLKPASIQSLYVLGSLVCSPETVKHTSSSSSSISSNSCSSNRVITPSVVVVIVVVVIVVVVVVVVVVVIVVVVVE